MAVSSPAFSFDAKNISAQAAAKKHAAKLVTNVGNGTKEAIRMAIIKSIREGMSPFETARQIRTMVGMNARQTVSSLLFRTSLIEQGLLVTKIEKLMEKFIAKKIRERAINIARTETMNALNRGLVQSWIQAQREGLLPKNQQAEIIVSIDDRVCPICEPLDGQFVDMNDFSSHPGFHGMCRCTLGIAIPKEERP